MTRATDAPSRSPAVDWVAVDDEAVLHDSRTGDVHLLDPPAAAVWLALDGSRALGEIAEVLALGGGAPRDVVLADVLRFVDRLHALRALAGESSMDAT